MADFGLRSYQEEVVERALRRENIIIWLPTGGGKTRAAVYVAKRHLETTSHAKVVVLVNKVHLVEQHFKKEFKPHLGPEYKIEALSGDSGQKDFFGKLVEKSDVVICTAQILFNALTTMEENKHVELSDITLLIIDECHHTQKEGVYNKIMRHYLEKKLREEGKLPQILGLTASPGTGGAKILEKAVEHVLQICANLDSVIVSTKNCTAELKEKVPRPFKSIHIVDKRAQDPFGDHLKEMMQKIHDFMTLPPDFRLRECGTQEYELDVITLGRRGEKEQNRILAQCALHLREYNDALLINDTLRMMDAYRSLEDFYDTKTDNSIDETDDFLVGLFQENQVKLRKMAKNPQYENPKMGKLEDALLKQFGPDPESRGILFCKTRRSTRCLKDWVLHNGALQQAGIKAEVLTGAGAGKSHMTQNEQDDTIRKFSQGALNLLISTSVAEEGLDIPECNLVVRYGLLTNEIAQQQARGRARAPEAEYLMVGQTGGQEVHRERINELLEELTGQAIAKIQEMSPHDFSAKINALQKEALIGSDIADTHKMKKRGRFDASAVQLWCRGCFKSVASGSDIEVIKNMHHVNVNPDFRKHYKLGDQIKIGKIFDDWEPGRKIHCNNCNKEWGTEIKYRKIALLPNIAIKNFGLETPEGRMTVEKWKDVTFTAEEFDFEKYAKDNFPEMTID
ncbi:ATP-dependent RNA helicase DHX58-like [Scomber japonicus]|uniref:ATP-dependent RNA helicase DHX58-like n=1 Tax=Scomber japonicus TaxID=13676 RepID=UPI0023055222|nr:ATP-dependent RNA helicase DHX58-like [Scomber japonicus]